MIIFFILPEEQKKTLVEGRSRPQELEEGPRNGPYLLVGFKITKCFI